jgi:hypothetical protein
MSSGPPVVCVIPFSSILNQLCLEIDSCIAMPPLRPCLVFRLLLQCQLQLTALTSAIITHEFYSKMILPEWLSGCRRSLLREILYGIVSLSRDPLMVVPNICTATATQRENSQDRSVEDLLPPFSALTTDEERERKAELKNPGTYPVVANLDSFVGLPEYREENAPISGLGEPGSLASPVLAEDDDALSSVSADHVGGAGDPNVVILRVFEEPARKSSVQQSARPTTNPVSPASSHGSLATASRQITHQNAHHADSQGLSMLAVARSGGRDAHLLQHYRTTISPYILRAQRPEGNEDLFEIQARTYPPVTCLPRYILISLGQHNLALPCNDGSRSP